MDSLTPVGQPQNPAWDRAPLSWLTVSGPVGQRSYFTVGMWLAVLKYVIESVAVFAYTGQFFTVWDFVNPWLNSKAPFLQGAPELGVTWLLFTLPFVWIAVAMSIRRAADIGISPWVGLLVLIPLLNVLVMFVLAAIPSQMFALSDDERRDLEEREQNLAEAYQPPAEPIEPQRDQLLQPLKFSYKLGLAILVGCLVQLTTGAVSVWILQVYGFVLFFSTPIIAGTVAGFIYSGGHKRRVGHVTSMTVLMNCMSFTAMLLVGLDGAVCLIMAFPLLFPLSILGASIGASLANANLRPGRDERKGMVGIMLFLPICLCLESMDDQKPVHAVTTSVEIAAPPEVVWNQVVAFPDIVDELPWIFRLGIAAPLRARIEGEGVGAIRHCEFTTGSFVEPIRGWDPPRHLAFDVTSQPYPMEEWTPIPHLHPPHLEDGMRSLRGEFRLERMADGGTKLSGTTWYQLDVRPRLYWKCWADPVLHAIHRRVLTHIGNVATSTSSE